MRTAKTMSKGLAICARCGAPAIGSKMFGAAEGQICAACYELDTNRQWTARMAAFLAPLRAVATQARRGTPRATDGPVTTITFRSDSYRGA